MLSAARKISLPCLLRDRRRVHAALTAFAFVLASWLGVVHEATTVHVRCAAHGELVDSDAAVGAMTAPPAAPAAHDTLAGAPPLTRGHGDEHCLLASALRASRIAPASPTLAATVVVVADVAVIAPAAVQPPTRVYRLAPKTSPPA